MMKTILVTGIGGNVGYGILGNIRQAYGKDITLIGTNTLRVSAGNHLCDQVFEVPFSLDTAYLPAIREICDQHRVDLIIPSTDYEVWVLAEHRGSLPPVAASDAPDVKIFLDKYLTYRHFQAAGLPFADSCLPSAYQGQFTDCIVKPREGRGSRGIHINPEQPASFTDEYMVQPLLKGKEITTAFYVTRSGQLLGHITLERELSAGATSSCEVNFTYDTEIEILIRRLMEISVIRGSCNVQSIVTPGGIIPFEINCRISGTNSIRSQFGFRDTEYTVEEWLFNRTPQPPQITGGCAVRKLSDIIYPGIRLNEINNNTDQFHIHA